ncbi:hypothetical protein BU25DRAFT_458977 [Macroventuria anomochaeta]|uniref:Uncharacterized protein n=1 Tax=Macroventuria anomochaeta TaxID=301207 RepID=A0ACB6RZN9_9PLEO|nr:uncharacterized protein BU25DRAFT_458977 [Macroventuria anomochaeta]KAF2627182.1 hypothetical protein BU25DRAFT_458977 [Macroventuria anomochaeta]
MTGKQISLRKKLWPKSPSKINKKRKTFVPYNSRDHKLTGHQESWARSLTMSLSGWRTRQKFLKSQLEAHLKTEAERDVLNAQDTARYVALQIQKGELDAKLQAEAAQEYAQKAAVWADVPSPPKAQPAPIVQPAPVVDWRVKAHNGIIKKKLLITKRWSAVTWNQKSNVQERLLLLEDDGFDIKGLQDRKATSEEITAIILERAAAQQQPSITNDTLMQQPEESEKQQEGSQDSSLVWLDPVLKQSTSSPAVSASPSPKHAPSLRSQPTTDDPAAPLRQPVPVSGPQPAIPPVIEDNAQPFYFDEPYQPRASPRLKRKYDRGIEQGLEDAAGSCLAFKKRKVEDLTEDGLRLQALQEIKRKALRRVFRPARSICRKSTPLSRVVFSAEIAPINCTEKPSITTLDYLYAKRAKEQTSNGLLRVSSHGFEHMMGELRFLTDTSNLADTDISIYDPDFDEEPTYGSISAEDRIKQNLRKLQRQKSRIAISKDERGCLVVQGETRTLAELFKVLGEQGLYHTVDWKWDGLRLSPSSSIPWSLSPETQSTLMEAESRLRRYA